MVINREKISISLDKELLVSLRKDIADKLFPHLSGAIEMYVKLGKQKAKELVDDTGK